MLENDTLEIVRDALINQINANEDEKLTATPGASFTRILLTAKVPGDAGNGIAVAVSVSSGANLVLSASGTATCCAATGGAPVHR